jgi:hypothetical protein
MAGVWGRQRLAEPVPLVGSGGMSVNGLHGFERFIVQNSERRPLIRW